MGRFLRLKFPQSLHQRSTSWAAWSRRS